MDKSDAAYEYAVANLEAYVDSHGKTELKYNSVQLAKGWAGVTNDVLAKRANIALDKYNKMKT